MFIKDVFRNAGRVYFKTVLSLDLEKLGCCGLYKSKFLFGCFYFYFSFNFCKILNTSKYISTI